jgi:hypothetical protein
MLPRQNLVSIRGTSVSDLFSYGYIHSVILVEPIPVGTAIAPVTSIRLTPLPIAIADGLELVFQSGSCTYHRLIVSGAHGIGDQIIAVRPYVGAKVACGLSARLAPVDLTGRTYKAQVKKNLNDAAPYLTLPCITTPLTGTVEVGCTTTGGEDVSRFSATKVVTFMDLPQDEIDLQMIGVKDKETGKLIYPHYQALIDAAWYWDLEYTEGAKIIPAYCGLFWLLAEATL